MSMKNIEYVSKSSKLQFSFTLKIEVYSLGLIQIYTIFNHPVAFPGIGHTPLEQCHLCQLFCKKSSLTITFEVNHSG